MRRLLLTLCLAFTLATSATAQTVFSTGETITNINNALAAASCGDDFQFTSAGDWTVSTTPITLPNRGDCSGNPPTIHGSDDAADCPADGVRVSLAWVAAHPDMPRIASTDSGSVNALLWANEQANGWVVKCLEIAHSYSGLFYSPAMILGMGETSYASGVGTTTKAALARNIVFDRLYLHGSTTGCVVRALYVNGVNITLKNSLVDEIHCDNGDGGNAWAGINGTDGLLIDNNHFRVAGIGSLLGGGAPAIDRATDPPADNDGTPENVTITNNWYEKPEEWRATFPAFKNCVELKNAKNVLIEHNIFDGSWVDSQDGVCFLLSNIQGNYGLDITAITSSGGDCILTLSVDATYNATASFFGQTTGKVLHNVVAPNTALNGVRFPPGTGSGEWEPTASDTIVLHGTACTTDAAVSRGTIGQDIVWNTVRDVTIKNNVVKLAAYGMNLQGMDHGNSLVTKAANIAVTNNLFMEMSPENNALYLDGKLLTVSDVDGFVWDHNTFQTIYFTNYSLVFHGITTLTDFTLKNSIHPVKPYYYLAGSGSDSLGACSGPNPCEAIWGAGTWVHSGNLLVGGSEGGWNCASDFGGFGGNNTCPALSGFDALFRDPDNGDFRLAVGSPYAGTAENGTDPGVDMCVAEGFPDPNGDGNTDFDCGAAPPAGLTGGRLGLRLRLQRGIR